MGSESWTRVINENIRLRAELARAVRILAQFEDVVEFKGDVLTMSDTCRGCGKSILWGLTPDGKRIPLDPSAPIYTVNQVTAAGPIVILLPASDRKIQGPLVSHFATCPKANQFSRTSQKQGGTS